mmetsp:Transcript_12445/g.34938  ORF Transcript_12445/g.34938 Transcript_12445/m.34938 type:complete len:226 (+) Transcript_12445:2585-3262(+)
MLSALAPLSLLSSSTCFSRSASCFSRRSLSCPSSAATLRWSPPPPSASFVASRLTSSCSASTATLFSTRTASSSLAWRSFRAAISVPDGLLELSASPPGDTGPLSSLTPGGESGGGETDGGVTEARRPATGPPPPPPPLAASLARAVKATAAEAAVEEMGGGGPLLMPGMSSSPEDSRSSSICRLASSDRRDRAAAEAGCEEGEEAGEGEESWARRPTRGTAEGV